MPLYAHTDIKLEGKIIAEFGDAISEADAKKLGNLDQMKETGAISDKKPEPRSDLMEGSEEPE